MVIEFFEVVIDGFRWLSVVPSFSNYATRPQAAAPSQAVECGAAGLL